MTFNVEHNAIDFEVERVDILEGYTVNNTHIPSRYEVTIRIFGYRNDVQRSSVLLDKDLIGLTFTGKGATQNFALHDAILVAGKRVARLG